MNVRGIIGIIMISIVPIWMLITIGLEVGWTEMFKVLAICLLSIGGAVLIATSYY